MKSLTAYICSGVVVVALVVVIAAQSMAVGTATTYSDRPEAEYHFVTTRNFKGEYMTWAVSRDPIDFYLQLPKGQSNALVAVIEVTEEQFRKVVPEDKQ